MSTASCSGEVEDSGGKASLPCRISETEELEGLLSRCVGVKDLAKVLCIDGHILVLVFLRLLPESADQLIRYVP